MYDRLKGSSNKEVGAATSNGPAGQAVKAEEAPLEAKKSEVIKAEQGSP